MALVIYSMDFLIKKYPGGHLTQYIHSMKPGEELAFKGPLPKHGKQSFLVDSRLVYSKTDAVQM